MKLVFTAATALALLSSAAFAGVIPVTGSYCATARDSVGTTLDANGVWSVEGAPFEKILKSSRDSWVVAYKGEDDSHPGATAKITISKDKRTVTVVDLPADGAPQVYRRCK